MKICIEENCNNTQFGGDYCKYHQFKRKMRGGDLFKRKSPAKKQIPKESAKRKKDNRRYLQRISEKWEQDVREGNNICVFCGQVINKREDNHHTTGRDKTILDEEFWRWAHRKCHSAYHDLPVEKLIELGWWFDYLERIRKIDVSTYYKELRKQEKSKRDLEDSDI